MIEDRFDITLLNYGSKKTSVKKLMLEFIDNDKVDKYLNDIPCRIITNISEEDALIILKKFKRRGANTIAMICDFHTMRNSKLDDLLN